MNTKRLKIEPIHNIGIVDARDFGAKASQLRCLANLGLPVPTGFLMGSDIAREAMTHGKFKISKKLGNLKGLYALRASPTDRDWGSVDAILNLGMSDFSLEEIGIRIGRREALELYWRFINNFGVSVFGLEPDLFEEVQDTSTSFLNLENDHLLEESTLVSIVERSKSIFKQEVGFDFPQLLAQQLDYAFTAMVQSWYRPSAKILRTTRGAPDDAGVGLVLQKMILGIGSKYSGSGRITSIDSKTGEMKLGGYFVANTQGNTVLADSNRRYLLSEKQKKKGERALQSIETLRPPLFEKIKTISDTVLKGLGDAFNLEFTLENNDFYLIDAVLAERSARASVKVAVGLVESTVLTPEQALLKVVPQNLIEFLHPQISTSFSRDLVGSGLPASPGSVSGRVAFSCRTVSLFSAKGEPAILVRIETSPEDIAGIHDSVGVLTTRGGMTSHAAVIARGLGLPCVVGVSSLTMNFSKKTMISDRGHKFKEGDLITLDGTVGEVLFGSAEMTQPEISGAFSTLMSWADQHRAIAVRGNADTSQEAQLAKDFGADGIGLCRTEHMFFEPKRLLVMRQMILAEEDAKRHDALKKLLPMQREDFIKIFRIMKGQPVTIRLLDPPLHEFLPHSQEEMGQIADSINEPLSKIMDRARHLEEFNPMLGKRGVRLGITLPEIYEMQAQAIFEAASSVNLGGRYHIVPEIMIPLVSTEHEVKFVSKRIKEISLLIGQKMNCDIHYKLGAVLETPRAALKAHDLSNVCDFLSFGTNDLTQMTYGLSRDDAGRFMRDYLEKEVFPNDPFHSLDLEGVGELILIAAKRARKSGKFIELGLCGEHGGDPNSIKFCLEAAFDYVSCSPFRIPIARLAAAQASILQKKSADAEK